jgi:omega-6 fatty acid desaturase (delta-12 desaturase)
MIPSPAGRDTARAWQRTLAHYRSSDIGRGAMQLAVTLGPLVVLVSLMFWVRPISYWYTLALTIPASAFLVRTFIIMHDCAHGSFTPSRRINEVVGFITGVLTLTPFVQWRRDHAIHHASSGDLDRRGHGDIITLTIEEYLARDRWGRLKYRLYRNPLILFGLGPLYLIIHQRWRARDVASGPMQGASVRATNVAILAMVVALSLLAGPWAVIVVCLPVFLLAASAGIWLFYVQHQFDGTYWERNGEWDFHVAAMQGSSYYRLPRVLEWFTGSIGLHHLHHLEPRIPSYNLRPCHDATAELHEATEVTLRASLRTVSLKLWDPDRRRLVGFDAVRGRHREGAEAT